MLYLFINFLIKISIYYTYDNTDIETFINLCVIYNFMEGAKYTSLDHIVRTLEKLKERYRVDEKILVRSKEGLDSMDPNRLELYKDFLLSRSLEELFNKRGSSAIRIVPIARVLIERYGEEGLNMANRLINILLSNKNLETSILPYIDYIILDSGIREIPEKLLQVVESYAKLLQAVESYVKADNNPVNEILKRIFRMIVYKKGGVIWDEDLKGYRYVKTDDQGISKLLDIYSIIGDWVVEYMNSISYKKRAEKLIDFIEENFLKGNLNLDDIIKSLYIYRRAGLLYHILEVVVDGLIGAEKIKIYGGSGTVDENGVSILFNKSIAEGLSKMPKEYVEMITDDLVDLAKFRRINKDDVELIANLINTYGWGFPQLVKDIIIFWSWYPDINRKTAKLVLEDTELKSILKSEYIEYPSDIKEFLADIIQDSVKYGYVDKLKPLLNNPDFKRMIETLQYTVVTDFDLTRLRGELSLIMKLNDWDKALRKLSEEVLSTYSQ